MLVTIIMICVGVGIINLFMKICFGVGWLAYKLFKYVIMAILTILVIIAALK